ncbi:Metallo-dependent phosphatase-like protein [Phlyctochytrium arcticum]|nr:Metallo-dependent phosphatase-like protein [Phlyctochytrium arcticum]
MKLTSTLLAVLAASATLVSARPLKPRCTTTTSVAPVPTSTTKPRCPPSQPTTPPTPPPRKNSMTVLATNDIHTHLDQFNTGGTDCRPKDIDAGNCFGGSARIQYMVDKFRAERDNVVLLDAGDQFQGTLFFNVFGGEKSAEIMNQLKYDAMCIGNHEFDNGLDFAATFFKNLTFPVVSSNIDLTTAPQLKEAGVKPYTILKDYGVGIIGYITNTTASITTGAKDVTFYNPVPVVQKYVDELHAQGIRRIICVSHNGYDQDQYLAKNVRGLNLIVGGHSHSLLLNNRTAPGVEGPFPTEVKNPDGKSTWIVQSHRYGDYLGHVDLTWNEQDELIDLKGEAILLDQSIPVHNATAAKVAKWRESFAILTETIVGTSTAEFPNAGCGIAECAIGNLLADSMLENRKALGAQIAFTNSGGIRAALPGGKISVSDVMTILPFGNAIVQFPYTGREIKVVLERLAARKVENSDTPLTSIAQWAGLKWTYDPSSPEFSRVKSAVVIDGDKETPLEDATTYQVLTNDFVAGGGDSIMPKLKFTIGDLQADAFTNLIKKRQVVTPQLEGRFGPVKN